MTQTQEQEVKELHDKLLEWKKKIEEQESQPKVFQRRFFSINMEEILKLADEYKNIPAEMKRCFDLNEAEIVKKLLAL